MSGVILAHTQLQNHIQQHSHSTLYHSHKLFTFQYPVLGNVPSRPPSTTMVFPFRYAPAREARYKIWPVMSVSSPMRPSGTMDLSRRIVLFSPVMEPPDA